MIGALKQRAGSRPGGEAIQWRPLAADRFEVRVPAGQELRAADLIEELARTGRLEFRVVPYRSTYDRGFYVPAEELAAYERLLEELGPDGVWRENGRYVWLALSRPPTPEDQARLPVVAHEGMYFILVCNTPGAVMLHGRRSREWSVTSAHATTDDSGRPAVVFTLDAAGAERLSALGEAHRPRDGSHGHVLALIVDDVVCSTPVIMHGLGAQGILTGQSTAEEARHLARLLEAAALPAKLDPIPIAEYHFGAEPEGPRGPPTPPATGGGRGRPASSGSSR